MMADRTRATAMHPALVRTLARLERQPLAKTIRRLEAMARELEAARTLLEAADRHQLASMTRGEGDSREAGW